MLHHPQYRERYAANLRRKLPRIPFVNQSQGTEGSTPPEGATPVRAKSERTRRAAEILLVKESIDSHDGMRYCGGR